MVRRHEPKRKAVRRSEPTRMKKLLWIIFVAMVALTLAPEPSRIFDAGGISQAEARGRLGGGMRGGGGRSFRGAPRGRVTPKAARRSSGRVGRPSGARKVNKARPKRPTAGIRPSKTTRPSARPTKPKKPKPAKLPPKGERPKPPGPGAGNRPGRPEKPGAGGRPDRPGKPGAGDRPGRPGKPGVGDRPGRPDRPGAGNRPNRPGVSKPGRPPNVRPPVNRPPGWRPPGYRPPHWRPPGWRPPAVRPPYVRPPHPNWGRYYWYPRWGWYFTGAVAGGTLAYVLSLPDDDPCEEVRIDGEIVYVCDGVTYRATLYRNERVYEIVTPREDTPPAETVFEGPLRLTKPMMRGPEVRELQEVLVEWGYDVGTVDGVFGRDTDEALRAFQRDYGLEVNGVLDDETAKALGL